MSPADQERLRKYLTEIEIAIEHAKWEVQNDTPLGLDGYHGAYAKVAIVVGGAPGHEEVLSGAAMFTDRPVVINLPPQMARRALYLARAARKVNQS